MSVSSLKAFNLERFIEDHREALSPPEYDVQVFEDADFIVTVVGGPIARDDYHVDEGPELYYQLEGEMRLRTLTDGVRDETTIGAGEMLLLPPRVPHSAERPAHSIGLVVQRRRLDHELDGFVWYCDACNHKLYEEYLYIDDIADQRPPIFDRFYESLDHRTCDRCGAVKPAQDDERP